MAYNYLREAEYIRNSTLCEFDTNSAYEVLWHENGNLEGWDSYSSIHTYGVWNGVLFGTSFGGDCYIGRSAPFGVVEAEDYSTLVIQMKIIVDDLTRGNITGGKVQWLRDGDLVWNDDKSAEFDVVTTDSKWRTYLIDLRPEQWYQGNIRNLRIYPFLNSRRNDQFFIRMISLRAESTFKCTNVSCSYYSQYVHPCPGVGEYGACRAGEELTTTVDIVEDVNDRLIVNIDDYGDQPVRLTAASGLTRSEVAREIEKHLTRIDIGGYVNATVESVVDKLKINSGTLASDSSVVLEHTQLAEDLGFFDGTSDVSRKTTGTDSASGFDYKASYRLRGVEIFKLLDGDTEKTAFYHDPNRYEVEAGRQDWQEKSKGEFTGEDYGYGFYFSPTFSGGGYTIIDFTHPFNSNGRVKKISVMGATDGTAGGSVKIFRPKMDGTLTVVEEVAFGIEEAGSVYSGIKDTYVIDTDVWVRKGDLVGFYNTDIYLGDVLTDEPDAMFYYISGEATGTFSPGELIANGNFGLNYYARGDRRQDLVLLDIDMGDRVNISSLTVYGEEVTEDFEFNIAICDDINWSINLFGGTHTHQVDDTVVPENSYRATHTNIAYGRFLLGDGITHTEDALAGTSYGMGGDGFWTGGTTYFYVNGDAEWLNDSPGEDFGMPRYSAYPPEDFYSDPVAFNLIFQDNKNVHKTRIFFKERFNFDKFHWAYYIGAPQGNTYDDDYRYIPDYTKVVLDDMVFDVTDEDMDQGARAFLFNNPTDSTWKRGPFNEALDGFELANPEEAYGSAFASWNVIEHEFDSVNTKAIQLYTNKHRSTKLMEIEVYSSISNEASLLDDVVVQYSREEDLWFFAALEDVVIAGETVAAALINDNPRYLSLEVRSSSTIRFTEFSLQLNEDAVRSGETKCLESIHFPTTKRGVVNPATSFPIWNTYEEDLDMQVDIPRDEGDQHLILWSKMGSADELAIPEIGPAGTYYKNPDYPLQNMDYNVAINCPCWGLQNLANGKDVYYNYGDTEWFYWGTYASGTSFDFSHPNKRITEFEFDPTSAKYFKFVPTKSIQFVTISEMVLYYADTVLDYTPWTQTGTAPSTPFSTPAPFLNDDDFTTGGYILWQNPAFVVDEFEGTSLDTTTRWTAVNQGYLSVAGGYLIGAPNSSTHTQVKSETKWYLAPNTLWRVQVDFDLVDWAPPSTTRDHEFNVGVVGINSGWGFSGQRQRRTTVDRLAAIWDQTGTWPNGNSTSWDSGWDNTQTTGLYFRIELHVGFLRMVYGSAAHGDEITYDKTGSWWLDSEGFWLGIHMQAGVTATPPTFKINQVFVDYGSGSPGLIGGSFDVATAVDRVRVVHSSFLVVADWAGESFTPFYPELDVYASYDNIHYFLWRTVTGYTQYGEIFDTYLAIDLDQRHSLDMVRHYGTGASSFAISGQQKRFNDDVSDPNLIAHTGAETGSIDDCRWEMILIPETETVRKIGIYPNIGEMSGPAGGYNHLWDYLGTILTDYGVKTNVAFDATVSGSSFFEGMGPSFVTDGFIPDGDVTRVWGSDEETTQWLKIYLDDEYMVDEFRCYWGYLMPTTLG
jgi:hypothetical protein